MVNTEFVGRVKILLVDDRDENFTELEAILRPDGTEIHQARSGSEALKLLMGNKFTVALLNVQMQGMSGFEVAELIRGASQGRAVPLVFLSAMTWHQGFAFKGCESGSVDFLYKPLDPRLVRSKMQMFFELERQRMLLQEQVEKLTQTEIRLQEAIASRDEFLSIASHELKTPLTFLKLQSQMTQRRISKGDQTAISPKQASQLFKQSDRQVGRLTTLVEALLDVSRIQAGKLEFHFEKFNFRELLDETMACLSDQAERARSSMRLSCEPTIMVNWDRFRIEQVVVNLLTNALKYASGKPLIVSVTMQNQNLRLIVKDFGPGIEERFHATIFDRFARAASAKHVGGLGLGLFIVRRIVEGHAGQIRLISAPGKGAEFVIDLPLDPARLLKPRNGLDCHPFGRDHLCS